MATIYTDFVSGTLTAGISISDSSFSGAGLTTLAAVGGTDIAKMVLDPFGQVGAPEIVYVTAHTASATTVTGVQRGQEGTIARPHTSGELFMNVPTSADFRFFTNQISSIVGSPGTTLGTGAPTDLAAGGGAQTGSSISVSKSDHRHALPAGTPGASAVGDAANAGTSTSVARSDHTHSREAFSSLVTNVGTSSLGSAATLARGDHSHAMGANALSAISQIGSAIEVTTICTSTTRPSHAKGRQIVETDTSRRYESDGTNWLRREVDAGVASQTGCSFVATPTIANNTLTRITSFTVNGSRDTDTYRADGQYGFIPSGLSGIYLVSWHGVTNDGSAPSWMEIFFTLTNAFGTGINFKYSANNGTKSTMAMNSRYIYLPSNQYFAMDVMQQAGSSKQINVNMDMVLLKNTGP